MANLKDWAQKELDRLVESDDDGTQKEINKDIMEIVEKFSSQGHSGFSASYALSVITRLLDWKPITALTGEDDEWAEPREGDPTNLQQNKRCFAVFRENFDNGTAHYNNGKIFSDDGGNSWYSSRDSGISITFPFVVPDRPERIILK